MPLNPNVRYDLECDVCATTIHNLSRVELDTAPLVDTRKHWKLYHYQQDNLYNFYALVCSDKCRDIWENTHLKEMRIKRKGTIPISSLAIRR